MQPSRETVCVSSRVHRYDGPDLLSLLRLFSSAHMRPSAQETFQTGARGWNRSMGGIWVSHHKVRFSPQCISISERVARIKGGDIIIVADYVFPVVKVSLSSMEYRKINSRSFENSTQYTSYHMAS